MSLVFGACPGEAAVERRTAGGEFSRVEAPSGFFGRQFSLPFRRQRMSASNGFLAEVPIRFSFSRAFPGHRPRSRSFSPPLNETRKRGTFVLPSLSLHVASTLGVSFAPSYPREMRIGAGQRSSLRLPRVTFSSNTFYLVSDESNCFANSARSPQNYPDW